MMVVGASLPVRALAKNRFGQEAGVMRNSALRRLRRSTVRRLTSLRWPAAEDLERAPASAAGCSTVVTKRQLMAHSAQPALLHGGGSLL